jgi:hypothetical protein
MPIYWMKTADVYPDSGWREDNAFMAFDPDVRFPRFHMVEGDDRQRPPDRGRAAVRTVGMVDDRCPARSSLWPADKRRRS